MRRRDEPVGAILAGGLGRRMGGAKATVLLAGQPLICYPLAALQRSLRDVVILAKTDTELPSLPGVTVWVEPDAPRHPLIGIMHALSLAAGRPALVCAADLPFVTSDLVNRLACAQARGAPAVLAASEGRMQPLLGRYDPAALELLRAAGPGDGVRLLDAVRALGPRLIEVEHSEALFNVNSPDELLQAAAMMDRLSRT
jgi:molybdopterin-guanine dinucleotide biosynthesis protein A